MEMEGGRGDRIRRCAFPSEGGRDGDLFSIKTEHSSDHRDVLPYCPNHMQGGRCLQYADYTFGRWRTSRIGSSHIQIHVKVDDAEYKSPLTPLPITFESNRWQKA